MLQSAYLQCTEIRTGENEISWNSDAALLHPLFLHCPPVSADLLMLLGIGPVISNNSYIVRRCAAEAKHLIFGYVIHI